MKLPPALFLLGLTACASGDKTPAGTDTGASTPDDNGGGTTDDSQGTTEPYGPDNAWYHAPDASLVPAEPETDAWEIGGQVPNLRFTDQNGDEVWLYQFYGQPIYLDWVAEWCGPCATFAPYLDTFYQTYRDDAVVLTVLYQDETLNPGDADAVSRWVADHGATNPVLWLDSEQYARTTEPGAYPEINLVDPELRLAPRSVNTLHNDDWIEQVIDRMAFAIGGSLDQDTETCDNAIDDDLDLIADCMDDACADDPACADSEVTGSLSPCTPDPDGLTTTADVWQLEVRGAVAAVEADNVSEATGFENLVRVIADGDTYATSRVVGDDDWDCTWPLETFGCARGWVRPGTYQMVVYPGTGGSDENDGDCVDPDLGEYVLRFQGDVSLELIQDNVALQSL